MRGLDDVQIGEDFDDNESTLGNVVLLWDMLKAKFRKSEEDEMARIIGQELIQKCEDLRDDYNNFYEIYKDLQESQSAEAKELEEKFRKSTSLLSAGGNAKFLNQELLFFIENLQKKAVDSGLEENSLIPNKDNKDKKIFEYILKSESRPQSAVTGLSSPSKMSNSFARNVDPAGLDATMRSSFYSSKGFANSKGNIVDSLKVKNVLELNADDKNKIQQIRDFMQEQADGLDKEILELQRLIMEPNSKPEEVELPSQKELKDYSSKLQEEYLKSDQTVKVQKALNVPPTHGRKFSIGGRADPLASLKTPGHKPTKSIIGGQTPLKLPPKGAAMKVIPKAQIDKESPEKDPASQITRMVLKRGNSQQKLKITRAPSKGSLQGEEEPKQKLKIKMRPSSNQRNSSQSKIRKIKKKEKQQELYGLDLDFIQGLGLGDVAQSQEIKNKIGQKSSELDNMTFEELRNQFNIEGQNTAVGKLRGLCKQYNNDE